MCGSRLVWASCCRSVSVFLFVVVLNTFVQGASISFLGEGYIPQPNEEVTVYLHTDTPLLSLGAMGSVSGDATITGAMSDADCDDYGWDPGWTGNPYIDDANGWVNFCGVSWARDANNVIGYFTFIYHGGQVVVSIDGEAYDANAELVPFTENTLVFGEPDPNDPNFHDPNGIFSYPPPTSQQQDPEPEYWQYMFPQSDYSTDPMTPYRMMGVEPVPSR